MRWLVLLVLVPLVVAQGAGPADNGTSDGGADNGTSDGGAAGGGTGGADLAAWLPLIVSVLAVAGLLVAFVYVARR